MKYLKVLVLLIGLASSTSVLAQEKEVEKPKEAEKAKEAEKPTKITVTTKDNLSNIFRKSNDPGHFFLNFYHHRNRGKAPLNPIPDVTEVELVFDEIVKDDSNSDLCFPDKAPGIEVITKVKNPNSGVLVYNYTVSAGRIIGQGEKVVWNLSGVKAGTYTITAAVDDSCGFCGKTQTKTITIKECLDCK